MSEAPAASGERQAAVAAADVERQQAAATQPRAASLPQNPYELLLDGKRFVCTECGKCCQGSGERGVWGWAQGRPAGARQPAQRFQVCCLRAPSLKRCPLRRTRRRGVGQRGRVCGPSPPAQHVAATLSQPVGVAPCCSLWPPGPLPIQPAPLILPCL